MDGMWGFFKVYRQDHGGLEMYTMIGRTLQDVVLLYAELVGFPLLVPRWAFGYLAGGMKYSMLDSPRASDALAEFTKKGMTFLAVDFNYHPATQWRRPSQRRETFSPGIDIDFQSQRLFATSSTIKVSD